MKRLLTGILLAGALSIVPSTLNAQDSDHERGHDEHSHRTYYDNAHKDKHEWNSDEDSAWNRYREERHVKQSDFSRASHKQQQNYWNWRHEHENGH